jgi:hypothetical protein
VVGSSGRRSPHLRRFVGPERFTKNPAFSSSAPRAVASPWRRFPLPMGNVFACMPGNDHIAAAAVTRSKRMGSARSARGAPKLTPAEEELLHRQALAMAIHQHLDAGGSMSRRIDGGASLSRRTAPGSVSSRRRADLPESVTNAKAVSPLPAPFLLFQTFPYIPASMVCIFFRSHSHFRIKNFHASATVGLHILELLIFSAS